MAKPKKKPGSGADVDPEALLRRVRELVQAVSGFIHLTPAARRKINSAATLPDRFYMLGALAVDKSEWLSTTANLTGEDIRRMFDFSAGFTTVANELELLAKGLRATVAARRGDVGERLLLAYAVAKRFNRTNANSQLIEHIREMQEELRARRRRRAKAVPGDSMTAPAAGE